MKILLATDGSEHSDAAVDEITQGHFPSDSEVRVISVVDPPYFPTPGGVDVTIYDDMQKTAVTAATAAVEKAAGALRVAEGGRKLTVTTNILFGSPKRAILEEADAFGADLIVVASHGHGALDRFLLGSVSQAVALHAKCSVEIVRRPKQTPRS